MSKRRRAQRLANIVNGARVELVAAISGIMVAGDPTPFVFEGAMRAGIRSGLVLTGEWTWARADETAREITREALEKIGAKRPTWAQGQPRYTEGGAIHQERDTCARCRKPIPMERILGSFAPVLYCDKICTQAAAEARYRQSRSEEETARCRARDAAYRRAKRRAMPLTPCEYCGVPFHPRPPKPSKPASRFCSLACRNKGLPGVRP